MKLRFTGILLIILVLFISGCTKDALTSPSFAYAGEWNGTWIDYNFVDPNSGHPVRCYTLVLNVAKDGTTTGEGSIEIEFIEGLFVDRLKMWMTVLPDGSAYGIGMWDVHLGYEQLAAEEGQVLGQFNSDTGEAGGSLIIESDGITWQFPWQVSKK